ncbi:MAG: ATP-dependent Clp protease ATP-binding subunit [Candidatus Komeilibacteria bacterium]|nr:ATP-dependent Clp protease ATP-binding subunit [Candidatus Komeilibacteria bacterium]
MMNNLESTFEKFTTHFKKVLITAQELAVSLNNQTVEPLHLLYAIAVEKGSIGADILSKENLTGESAKDIVVILTDHRSNQDKNIPSLSPVTQKAIERAIGEAYEYRHRYVGTEHLLSSLLTTQDGNLLKFLHSKNIQPSVMRDNLEAILRSTSKFSDLTAGRNEEDNEENPESEMERMFGMGPARADNGGLTTYTIDLTDDEVQKDIDPVIGREKEIERLIQILSRRTKNNPILLGDPGVGKTAIIEGLAKRITEGKVPDVLANKKIYSLDLGSMIAGTIYRGEFESRIKKLVEQVKKSKNVILFIDEIHNLMGAGSAAGSLDAANIIKPELARGHLRCIGTTTREEFKKHIETDPAFERRFQPITVKEATAEEALDILKGLRKNYEKFHRVKISDEAITAAVELSVRYLQDKFLPDKAIDLIDEAASKLKVEMTKDGRGKAIRGYENKLQKLKQEKEAAIANEEFSHALALKEKEGELLDKLEELSNLDDANSGKILGTIRRQDITEVISRITNVPVHELALTEKERLMGLEKELQAHVIGQDDALRAIARSIRRSRTGLANPDRPVGSFIFLGPSGVGKTETAKVIAREFFGRKDALVRIDMSEFSEKFNISKLIGSPAGYVGYKEQGKLTDAVKHQPYSVILFDEIEKAHPDVYNLLLSILEDGHLTDATGKTINFKNTIIIMTSNIGLQEFNRQAAIGFSTGSAEKKSEEQFIDLSQRIQKGLKEHFRPEFLNRIDDVIIFKPLNKESLLKIARLQMEQLLRRLLLQQLKAEVSQKTLTFLVDKGFSPEQGARGIRRAIQEHIEAPLADKMLSEEMTDKKILKINVQKDKVKID